MAHAVEDVRGVRGGGEKLLEEVVPARFENNLVVHVGYIHDM